ncbi:mycothiol synthase [Terrabacter sp. Root85]|uniref:mycothiol synthase n=1 Tax=Terrabacter sp. Root85 TaxID=1736603 RepID=UPI0006F60361|nr:mycothiol synthase [Terrabacter sp. Root85]KRC92181.1 mycothiol synthase [Terrabacter sp. Root85]
MPRPTVALRDTTNPLTPDESATVLALAAEAADADGSEALSEQFRLSVRSREHDGVGHLLALGPDGTLVGYAQSRSGEGPPSGELVVAPGSRRSGVGTALLARLPDGIRLWSHATGAAADAATAFARATGLVPVRSLHVMGRSLRDGPAWPAASLDPRYAVRSFEPGRDEDAWLALNAAAFAHHPEQGSLRRADLDQRMAEPWWDPAGLVLVVEAAAPDVLAASHWTKVDPPDGDVGEVYVVAVSPDRQGQGLGRAVTVLGLDHLRSLSLARVVLYVDEDNVAAVRTYAALGFEDVEVHRQFARASEASEAGDAADQVGGVSSPAVG